MASTAQLKAKGREIEARLGSFAKDFEEAVDEKGAPKYTEDEKETAYKTLRDEFKSWQAEYARSEGASEMASKLAEGGCGAAMDTKTGKVVNTGNPFEAVSPFANGGIKRLAYEASQIPEFQRIFEFKDGFRKGLDHTVELGAKSLHNDATEANNLMGEGLDANNNIAAGPVGQNPFLAGTFGQGILPDWRPGIVEQLFYKLTINDLISSFATTAPNISYLTEASVNLQATATAEHGTFPFSSIELAREYAQIGKIANALTISDEAISDAATLYNFVQSRLLLSVQRREEVEILAGTGYPGVGGLLSFAANFTVAASGTNGSLYNGGTAGTISGATAFPPAGTNGAGVQPISITGLNVGRVVTGAHAQYPDPLTVSLNLKDAAVDVELAVFEEPTAHIMHPRDWERIETAQDANQQFMNTNMFGNVYGVGRTPVRSLWGVPVVTTPLVPQGLILTGWFSPQTVQVARRQGVQMQMTNSNESDFITGKITVRADERLGLLCYRPTAFQLTHLVVGP